ncbi:hypothetical protein [Hyphomonas pacifica]|uniref:Uncharacterized protein n=1 Tax=Hyphomonas pacifica TaxID=1280941 RepID=A0A062TTV1_9PROT|nr:hypothetical protein [Hyphomonas pacifica]KCZ46847.1 hypothetical protein HY2_05545 [Hyphomonas pacifica]RAN30464.1 hypothetical protein HY3_06520 [Hyphomonas pacifica]
MAALLGPLIGSFIGEEGIDVLFLVCDAISGLPFIRNSPDLDSCHFQLAHFRTDPHQLRHFRRNVLARRCGGQHLFRRQVLRLVHGQLQALQRLFRLVQLMRAHQAVDACAMQAHLRRDARHAPAEQPAKPDLALQTIPVRMM